MPYSNIITEVPPITEQDSFVIFERRKSSFNFPIHIHKEFEINYVCGAKGARRIVGDNIAEIGDRDLVLIAGSNLEHGWSDGNMDPDAEIYEVTIQFSPSLFASGGLIDRKQFLPIKALLKDAEHGISFSQQTILQCDVEIRKLIGSTDNFNSVLVFLNLLNIMAHDENYAVLTHSHFHKSEPSYDSKRMAIIMEYLGNHYREVIRLDDLAKMINMSIPSFSRFIKRRTGYSFVDCLNNIRIGAATRLLIDEPVSTIAEIAYKCGFNNISNFNRQFKRRKSCTPHDFREYYSKNKIII